MTDTKLVKVLARKLGVTQKESEKFIRAFKETLVQELETGEKIILKNLITIDVAERPARMARNPRTGEEIKVRPKRVIKTRVSQALKDAVEKKL